MMPTKKHSSVKDEVKDEVKDRESDPQAKEWETTRIHEEEMEPLSNVLAMADNAKVKAISSETAHTSQAKATAEALQAVQSTTWSHTNACSWSPTTLRITPPHGPGPQNGMRNSFS